ncbi:hypothetical protein [Pseudomonas sp. CGJS7]|uniref:hypothetical protein n=1 Tax=Pseudomonas sp. CGJS7 TaxID=3109348 RepID=UPI003009B21C
MVLPASRHHLHAEVSSRARLLRLTLAGALAALSGCVVFDRAPVSELSCDPDLPGTWNLKADGGSKIIHIDARCHTDNWPGLREQPVALDLTGFVLGRNRYIVFSPADAERALGAEGKPLSTGLAKGAAVSKDAVFLVLYRLEGDRASAWLADPALALNAVAQDRLHGGRLDEQYALIRNDPLPSERKIDNRNALVAETPDRLRVVLGEQPELLFAIDRKSATLTRVKKETASP